VGRCRRDDAVRRLHRRPPVRQQQEYQDGIGHRLS
jgi:hypothetical protein